MKSPIRLFPNLPEGKWVKLNLNEEAKPLDNDFTDARQCSEWIRHLHAKRNASYSYGGFLENRSHLWRSSYLAKTNAFIHLGVDYTIPSGTDVASPVPGRVEHVMLDKDQDGGWGGRVIISSDYLVDGYFSNEKEYFIYGHLAHDLRIKPGDSIKPGQLIGKVGEISEDGNWFPHLHLQLVTSKFLRSYKSLEEIDGYLPLGDKRMKEIRDPSFLF